MKRLSLAANVAAALDGAYPSGPWWRCSCPVHGSRGATLALRDAAHGLVVHCHGGCAQADILLELRRRGLLDDETGDVVRLDPSEITRQREFEARQRRHKTAIAIDIWNVSYPVQNTPAERYLRCRGYTRSIPPTLRYQPMFGCYGRHPSGSNRPQLIGL